MNPKLKTLSALLLVAVIAVFQSGLTLFSFTCYTAKLYEVGLTEPISCCKTSSPNGMACAAHQAPDTETKITNKCCDIQVHHYQVEHSVAPIIQHYQAPVLAVLPTPWLETGLLAAPQQDTRYAGLRGPPRVQSPHPALFEAYQVWRI